MGIRKREIDNFLKLLTKEGWVFIGPVIIRRYNVRQEFQLGNDRVTGEWNYFENKSIRKELSAKVKRGL